MHPNPGLHEAAPIQRANQDQKRPGCKGCGDPCVAMVHAESPPRRHPPFVQPAVLRSRADVARAPPSSKKHRARPCMLNFQHASLSRNPGQSRQAPALPPLSNRQPECVLPPIPPALCSFPSRQNGGDPSGARNDFPGLHGRDAAALKNSRRPRRATSDKPAHPTTAPPQAC